MRPDQALQPISRAGTGPAPQQNVIQARVVIISGPGEGIFSYFPTPGPDNLVASTGIPSNSGGTDPFGNKYLGGDTTYGLFAGVFFAVSLNSAGIQYFTGGNHQNLPYIEVIGLGLASLVGGAVTPLLSIGGPHFGGIVVNPGVGQQVTITPSGDTTGAKDTAAINAAFTVGITEVILLPGNYYTNAPINMTSSYQVLRGAGYGFTTTIASAATSPQTAMIIVSGATTPLFETTLKDFALKGNANSGHGIIYRSNNGLIENVIVQGNPGGDAFHLSMDALPAANVFDVKMINCTVQAMGGTGNGIFIDTTFFSCEFYECVGQGGTAPGSPAGGWGILALGGQLKFITCHMFEWVTGGASFGNGVAAATDMTIIGGEYETNSGPGIEFNSCGGGRIIGAEFYGNGAVTSADVLLQSTTGVQLAECHFRSTVTRFVYMSNCTECSIVNCRGNNTSATNTLGYQLDTSVPVNTLNRIVGNQLTIHAGGTAIQINAATSTIVSANIVNAAITEVGAANFSNVTGNRLTAGVITLLGGGSIQANNN